ncbi:unnamed protein product [Enterobius vermicularis]|uniref:E3 ubiquitin-protein ligase n=1 Tax=Enterobius vermicularis TaxID=51028 RepID=A0A0N4VKE0_ENTVE|nr:unnamed protein product [Enterobius vermicularis]
MSQPMSSSHVSSCCILKLVCGETEVTVEQADITTCAADIVAVPVDRQFSFSHGISRCLAAAAGSGFKIEVRATVGSRKKISHKPGEVIIFGGHDLPFGKIIAVVSSHRFEDIKMLYENVLTSAEQAKASSLCFSGIGTGYLGVPSDVAAVCARMALSNYLSADRSKFTSLKHIRIVDLDTKIVRSFAKELKSLSNTCLKKDDSALPGDEGEELSLVFKDSAQGSDNAQVDQIFFSCFRRVDGLSDEVCPVCLDSLSHGSDNNVIIELSKCNHKFHEECIKQSFTCVQAQCPVCKKWYGVPRGNQPIGGKMKVRMQIGEVPGYPDAKGYFEIYYSIPGGVQTADHPRPGVPFSGTQRWAYLPNNAEGAQVLRLLRLAFRYRLIFTVGDSVTSGARNVVVWNNIHHKTSIYGGPYGYPDPEYLDRVKEELAAVGITEELFEGSHL